MSFEIIEWDGLPITKACIVKNVPMAAYHSQAISPLPSISSSGIRLIESKSPLHFFDKWEGNPDREEEEAKHHFSWGRALHHLSAGEADFQAHFAVRPDEWDSWRTKDAKQWRAQMEADGRDILVPDDLVNLRIAGERLSGHPTIQAGILNGEIECSIFWPVRIKLADGRVVEIMCKSRPDVLVQSANIIVDLKSTADASPVAVRRSLAEFGYYTQLAMAHEGLLVTTGRQMTDHVLVFIESKRPCAINIKPLNSASIEWGLRQFERGLFKFATAIADNTWDGYGDDEVECGLPAWLTQRLTLEAENGELPEIGEYRDHTPPISHDDVPEAV